MIRQEPMVSCPGKLLLCGEYAVLHGAPAVVAAVDRRAAARLVSRTPASFSPVLEAVRDEVRRYGKEVLGEDWSLPHVSVDTAAFRRNGRKLGLGSSAAAAVAACGAWLASQGLTGEALLEITELLAQAGHKRAQGGRGSGVDIAACVHGGVLRFVPTQSVVRLPRPAVQTVVVDTGSSASTAELLAAVEELHTHAPRIHDAHMSGLSQCATAFADAVASQDATALVRLAGDYGERMAALGEACGRPIVTPVMRRLAELAQAVGGASKPSGAGGGDMAVAFFLEGADGAERFVKSCRAEGLVTVRLGIGAAGLRLESPATLRGGGQGSVR